MDDEINEISSTMNSLMEYSTLEWSTAVEKEGLKGTVYYKLKFVK